MMRLICSIVSRNLAARSIEACSTLQELDLKRFERPNLTSFVTAYIKLAYIDLAYLLTELLFEWL